MKINSTCSLINLNFLVEPLARCTLSALITLCPLTLLAQQGAVTDDGLRVLLYPDGQWVYQDQLPVDLPPMKLGPFSLKERLARRSGPPLKASLKLISERANNVIDDARWMNEHGFTPLSCELPSTRSPGTCPARAPLSLDGRTLRRLMISDGEALLFYKRRSGGVDRLLIADEKLKSIKHHLDFSLVMWPAELKDFPTSPLSLMWAQRVGDVLYVANGYNGYARETRGKNAYLSAISLKDGSLIWRSRALVSNAAHFLIYGDLIISGYGFTAEPDYLYLIDRRSGAVVHKRKVKSGPSYLLLRGKRLYVRTYDRDYVFEIKSAQHIKSAQ